MKGPKYWMCVGKQLENEPETVILLQWPKELVFYIAHKHMLKGVNSYSDVTFEMSW